MLDAEIPAENPAEGAAETPDTGGEAAAPAKKAAAKRTAKKAAAKKAPAKQAAAKRPTAKRTSKKAAAAAGEETLPATETTGAEESSPAGSPAPVGEPSVAEASATTEAPVAKRATRKTAAKKTTTARRTTKKAVAAPEVPGDDTQTPEPSAAEISAAASAEQVAAPAEEGAARQASAVAAPLFQAPDTTKPVVTTRKRGSSRAKKVAEPAAPESAPEQSEAEAGAEAEAAEAKPARKAAARRGAKKATQPEPEQAGAPAEEEVPESTEAAETAAEGGEEEQGGGERRRRRRGGRRRRRSGGGSDDTEATEGSSDKDQGSEQRAEEGSTSDEGEEGSGTARRRRRRRRGEGEGGEEPRARKPRNAEDEITSLSGSTRLEAKKQRRREGREAGRRRAPIVSEAEFLARREAVDRVMVIRQREDLTQIAVMEDQVLVEHYVARESQTSLIGNVYLGRVQNVLPSMEAAFIDIGKGRNAVLYAGEVNWDALGAKNGTPRKIEAVLKSGQSILVQVTKDPIGHKGARLTSQISLPGRFLVYVPDGTTSGISRKLPDTERNRLKTLLKEIVPDSAGVIVRTAAEGASEDELTRDVERLTARWDDIEKKVKSGNAPQLLYGEPDLTLKVVRDLFTEDFSKLVISGDDAWDTVESYVSHVAPDLADRLEKYDGERDIFAEHRIDEQIEKALDRKVWLPSGGSLVIDRTEAMTVVDVNTGKFTGSGGNLEETVTKNNLEAAEEIVRQLRLRDIGGIIVVDFIDMVLESNRDLVLRRLVECLGRDRTRHQVAEVTSLGLVQMTRKRIGTGLLEAFSESCEACSGRGLVLHHEPVESKRKTEEEPRRGRRSGRGRGRDEVPSGGNGGAVPSPKDLAAMARHEEKAGEEKAGDESQVEPKQAGERVEATQVEARSAQGRPAKPPAADGPVEKAPAGEVAPQTQDEQSEQSGAEPAAAQAVAEEAATSTTSRGRGRGRGRARREAAPPEPISEPTTVPTAETTPAATSEPTPAPAADVAQHAAATEVGQATTETAAGTPVEAAAPAAATVVTTVRRRSARRAAGPPQGGTAVEDTDGAGSSVATESAAEQVADQPADAEPIAVLVDSAEVTDAGDGAVGAESPTTPHVPVKKRGSRRR